MTDDRPSYPHVDPDSRARTHLANERTYLAWLRTAITLIALGLAAAQFLTHDVLPGVPLVRILSSLLVGMGVILPIVAEYRYSRAVRHIEATTFQPARTSIQLSTATAAVIGLLALLVVWLLR